MPLRFFGSIDVNLIGVNYRYEDLTVVTFVRNDFLLSLSDRFLLCEAELMYGHVHHHYYRNFRRIIPFLRRSLSGQPWKNCREED